MVLPGQLVHRRGPGQPGALKLLLLLGLRGSSVDSSSSSTLTRDCAVAEGQQSSTRRARAPQRCSRLPGPLLSCASFPRSALMIGSSRRLASDGQGNQLRSGEGGTGEGCTGSQSQNAKGSRDSSRDSSSSSSSRRRNRSSSSSSSSRNEALLTSTTCPAGPLAPNPEGSDCRELPILRSRHRGPSGGWAADVVIRNHLQQRQ